MYCLVLCYSSAHVPFIYQPATDDATRPSRLLLLLLLLTTRETIKSNLYTYNIQWFAIKHEAQLYWKRNGTLSRRRIIFVSCVASFAVILIAIPIRLTDDARQPRTTQRDDWEWLLKNIEYYSNGCNSVRIPSYTELAFSSDRQLRNIRCPRMSQ